MIAKDIYKEGLILESWGDTIDEIKEAKQRAIEEASKMYEVPESCINIVGDLLVCLPEGGRADGFGFEETVYCNKSLPKMSEAIDAIERAMGEEKLLEGGFTICYSALIRFWETVGDKMSGDNAIPTESSMDIDIIKWKKNK